VSVESKVQKITVGYLKLLVVSSWRNTETTSSFVSRYETTSSFELVVYLVETTSSFIFLVTSSFELVVVYKPLSVSYPAALIKELAPSSAMLGTPSFA
jgi:hypothetical protein